MYSDKKLSLEEGKILVKLARESIKSFFEKRDLNISSIPENLKENRGAFVTLRKNNQLRGCIGYIFPIKPLYQAVIEVAREAAFNDPRFLPLEEKELEEITIEVSVLTKLKRVEYSSTEDLIKKIKVGRDGLYMKYGFYSGVLLPEVPIEENWNELEFLNYTCLKAGLPMFCWEKYKVDVYIFSAQIFKEREPNGEIERIDLY